MRRGAVRLSKHNNYRNFGFRKSIFLFLLLFLFPYVSAQTSSYHVNVDSLITQLKLTNVTNYTWCIIQPNDWNDLAVFLPRAKMSGISVQVALLSPSESPPINSTGNYSEPYQLDYITWAKEIAQLSLRYSNLQSYTIDNLQYNLNQGYLTQSYINNMISTSNSINPKLPFTTITSTGKYYVSNKGDDTYSGLSPYFPWKTIAKVNASTFQPGNYIYLKRGDVWREQLNVPSSGIVNNPITIGAYGSGNKPILNEANVITGWTNQSGNIWYANAPAGGNEHGVGHAYVTVINDSLCTEYGSLAALTQPYSVYYERTSRFDAGLVYIYSSVNPNNIKVEISARNFGVMIDYKNYVKISNLDVRFAGHSGIFLWGENSGNSNVDSCNAYGNRLGGIQIYNGCSNNIVQNCTSTYNGNGYYSATYSTIGSNNNTFSKCYSANNIRYTSDVPSDGHGFGLYRSKDCIVEYSKSYNDSYGINSDPNGEPDGAIFRYNFVTNSQDLQAGIGLGNIGAGASYKVYYNLLVNNGGVNGTGIAVPTTNGGTVYLYNNTVYQAGAPGISFKNASTCVLINNIIYTTGASVALSISSSAGTLTSNYNQFYAPNNNYIIGDGGTVYSSVTAWTNASGQDAHSNQGSPLFTNLSAGDFSLQTGSPCINTGGNVGLTSDYLNHPIIGQPDIGAFEKQ